MRVLGIDIGGTKTVVCAGTDQGTVLARRRIPTRAKEGPEAALSRIMDLVPPTLSEAGWGPDDVDAVGLSAPGPLDVASGTLHEPPNMKGWTEVPLREWFRKKLGKPTYIDNDANTAALAEYLFGTFKGSSCLVYLTLSTGIGSGIVIEGKVVHGAGDRAGEFGHCVLDPEGPPCPCGLRGCLEVFCGGKSVADRLRRQIREKRISTSIVDHAGGDPEAIDFRAFAEAVRTDDPFALDQWQTYTERLAQGLGLVMMALNPEVLLLGTIAIRTGPLLMEPLARALPRYVWPSILRSTRMAPSTLGADIGELAALAVAVQGHQPGR
jgi:glucokinase